MPGNLGNLYFVLEILVAEIMFSYAYPRRNRFAIRVVLSLIGIFVLGYFLPQLDSDVFGPFAPIFRFVSLWCLTVIGLAVCYKASPAAIIAAGSASYALQHFSYKFLSIIKVFIGDALRTFINPVVVTRAFVEEMMFFPVIYVLAFFIFARPAAKNKFHESIDNRFIIMSAATISFCVVLNRFTRSMYSSNEQANNAATICTALYAMVCTALSLIIQYNFQRYYSVKQENILINELLIEKQKNYETSKRNAELLNIKYHDLKYTFNKIGKSISAEDLESIKSVMDSYDSNIRTGNETIDIIIAEKVLRCREQGIRITFFGNGESLSFISAVDTYALFGNAIDNAVEAVERIEEADKRLISVVIENKADYVCVSLINYFRVPLEMENGLPVTTKKTGKGYHGYGMKSMKMIAEKYGGSIRVSAADDLFTLSIYFLAKNDNNSEPDKISIE